MKRVYFFLTFCCLAVLHLSSYSQKKDSLAIHKKDSVLYISSVAATADTLIVDSLHKTDTGLAKKGKPKKVFDPHRATLYSTFMPGLGQIYNRKYWKLPLVYAAVGIPAYTYFYNKKWYQKTQYALAVLLGVNPLDTTASWRDSLNKVDKQLKIFVTVGDSNDLLSYRNEFRKDQDYSVLFFLLFWGLNIVDATVDAHLRGFDVSTELSMHIAPSAPGTPSGFGLVFDFHQPKYRSISLP